MFPWSKQDAITIFDISVEGGERLNPITIQNVHDALASRLRKTKAPENLNEDEKDTWGWAWPDGSGPVSVDRFLYWLVRHWKKAPPPTLIAELAAKRCEEWKESHSAEKCPSAVRKELREQVREQITRSTPPAIVESPILLNVIDRRLIVFSTSDHVVDSQRGAVRAALCEITGQPIVMTRWSLQGYLDRSRPGAVFPSLVPQRFTEWLAEQALRSEWCTIDVPDRITERIGLSLGDFIETSRSSTGNGKHRVEGHKAVEEYVENKEPDAYITKIAIRIDHPPFAYTIRTNLDGHMLKCKIDGALEHSAANDEWEEAVLDRGDHYERAHTNLRRLWGAFNSGRLGELMRELPQKGLFEHHPVGTYTWSDEAPPPPPTPLEQAVNEMKKDLGEGNSMTVKAGGKEVTVEGKKKAKAKKKPRAKA